MDPAKEKHHQTEVRMNVIASVITTVILVVATAWLVILLF